MRHRNLRQFAKGKPCMVRLVGICNFNPETTVLAHIRRGNIAGAGQKPSDIAAVWACSACHDAMDGRSKYADDENLDADILAALCRQLAWYDEHEILIAVIAA